MKTILLFDALMGEGVVFSVTAIASCPVCKINSGDASMRAMIPRIFVFCTPVLLGRKGVNTHVLVVVA